MTTTTTTTTTTSTTSTESLDGFFTLEDLDGFAFCTTSHPHGWVCATCTLEEAEGGGEFWGGVDIELEGITGETCSECGGTLD